jgi:hypothetical protein
MCHRATVCVAPRAEPENAISTPTMSATASRYTRLLLAMPATPFVSGRSTKGVTPPCNVTRVSLAAGNTMSSPIWLIFVLKNMKITKEPRPLSRDPSPTVVRRPGSLPWRGVSQIRVSNLRRPPGNLLCFMRPGGHKNTPHAKRAGAPLREVKGSGPSYAGRETEGRAVPVRIRASLPSRLCCQADPAMSRGSGRFFTQAQDVGPRGYAPTKRGRGPALG